MKKIYNNITGIFVSVVITVFLLQFNCAAQSVIPKQIHVTVNDTTTIYDVPANITANLGDTLIIKAVLPPGFAVIWSGDLQGNENPTVIVADAPLTIKVDYQRVNSYAVVIRNASFIDKHTFEFEIWVKGLLGLTAYQMSLNFDQGIINAGTLTFEYIGKTYNKLREANMEPIAADVRFTDGYGELSFASGPAPDTGGVDFPDHDDGAAIGRFRLTNTNEFAFFKPDLRFDFENKIKTISTEVFEDATVPEYFRNLNNNEISVTIKFE